MRPEGYTSVSPYLTVEDPAATIEFLTGCSMEWSFAASRPNADEDRRGGVRGPGGVTWWIATRIG